MSRPLIATASALVLLAAPAIALGAAPSGPAAIGQPVAPALISQLQKASQAGLGLAAPPETLDFKAISGPRVATGNKVGILYIGANFCPYCAGQRWVLVLTLLRFGKFDGLTYMMSSSTDAYPDTPTFSFDKATYTSKYVDFTPVETADREGHRLMQPTKAQNDIFSKFDAPPYTVSFEGIPFVYVDGEYVMTRPMLMPDELVGMDWQRVVKTLSNPQSALFQSVMPQVNSFTAAICRLDGGNPDSVCSAAGVTTANGALLGLAQGS